MELKIESVIIDHSLSIFLLKYQYPTKLVYFVISSRSKAGVHQ